MMRLVDVLTPAQLRVARHVAAGKSNRGIATELGVSEHRVSQAVTEAFNAAGLLRDGVTNRRVRLALIAREQGL